MKTNGFTLLEVLIASVILFATIATASAVFSSSVISNVKATSQVKLSIYGSYIIDHVAEMVRMGETAGNGHWDSVHFNWQIIDVQAAPMQFKGESGGGVALQKQIQLNTIALTLETNTTSQTKQIKVVSWGL